MLILFSCNNEKRTTSKVSSAEIVKQVNDSSINNQSNTDIQKYTAYNRARIDLSSNNAKYYAYGIASPSKEFVDSFKMKYHLEVISVGCSPDNDMIYYNEIIDSFIQGKKNLPNF